MESEDMLELYRKDDVVMYRVKSKKGAILLGKETNWCASPISYDNAYEDNAVDGSLYVLRAKEGKFQLNLLINKYCDGLGAYINPRELINTYPIIWQLLHDDIKRNQCIGLVPFPIPKNIGTKNYIKWAEEAVLEDTRRFRHVPEEMISAKLCLQAVQQNYGALEYVPESLKSPNLCLQAVKQCGGALEYVPESLKSIRLCKQAFIEPVLRTNGIEFIPKTLLSDNMSYKLNNQYGNALKYVPGPLKSIELCQRAMQMAVQRSGIVFEYVPEPLKSIALCWQAVRRDGMALQYVPIALRSLEPPCGRIVVPPLI